MPQTVYIRSQKKIITFFIGDRVHFAHVHVFAMYGVGNLLVSTFVTMAGNDLEASRVTKLRLVISLFRDFAIS